MNNNLNSKIRPRLDVVRKTVVRNYSDNEKLPLKYGNLADCLDALSEPDCLSNKSPLNLSFSYLDHKQSSNTLAVNRIFS